MQRFVRDLGDGGVADGLFVLLLDCCSLFVCLFARSALVHRGTKEGGEKNDGWLLASQRMKGLVKKPSPMPVGFRRRHTWFLLQRFLTPHPVILTSPQSGKKTLASKRNQILQESCVLVLDIRTAFGTQNECFDQQQHVIPTETIICQQQQQQDNIGYLRWKVSHDVKFKDNDKYDIEINIETGPN